jgi:hypothetical protein
MYFERISTIGMNNKIEDRPLTPLTQKSMDSSIPL